ncbi:hypothetical protein BGZ96_006594 [Linnemannia gamsii]|uniref:Uncharacterized protein n=1 Tax=Linnemannia gamsii TaxID=64522 RepID=A0ABQ7KE66_9FUNG|nr:hypothetical protein BGZ96_006594 [Linnemannia gamsii]
MLYSYSSFSLRFSPGTRDTEDWTILEQRLGGVSSKTMRWRNTTLFSQFTCQSSGAAPSTHGSSTPSIHGSGFNRETICTVQNLCVDAERGAWIHPTKDTEEFPLINIVAADPGSDAYYRPAIMEEFPASTYRFVDETIFLYGRDPTHRPTWLLNNLLPLYSVMSSYGGSRTSWFMRVIGQEKNDSERKKQFRIQDNSDLELDTYLLAPYGREIIMNPKKGKPLTGHQINAPSKSYPTCFAKAVIGLQSRCTRPYCENTIGGHDIIGSLRTRVLDTLSTSMIRFQKTHPNIVHPLTGENVPVVSDTNLTVVSGESAPRSKINVALLGRYGNTSIPNANTLELSLLARGFSVQTIHLDYPDQISSAQAAQLFVNQSILVAPQGEALGYSTWMRQGTVVISILPRFTRSSKIYTDRMMAFGKRFFAWDCQDESCVQPDRDLAHECIEAIQDSYEEEQGITATEFEQFANMNQDFRQRSVTWKAIADCYTKEVSRRLNVEELTLLIETLAKDFTFGDAKPVETAESVTRRTLSRRGIDEDENEGSEDDEEETTTEQSDDDSQGSAESDNHSDYDEVDGETITTGSHGGAEEENLDKEDTVRIQGDKKPNQDDEQGGNDDDREEEEEEEDVNVHEYDVPPATKPEEETTPPKPATPVPEPEKAPVAVPVPESAQGQPVTQEPGTVSSADTAIKAQSIHALPSLGFAEFCQRGHCCGSVKISEKEVIGATGGKGLTPCAASMSVLVFGAKSVWGQNDESTIKESQSLVWQVDLGRHQRV